MHPVHCALAELPMCNQCFQTRTDSMSLFDHDDTMQHLILLGILINSAHRADMLALAHAQLVVIPYHKDFKHFSRKLIVNLLERDGPIALPSSCF